MLVRYRKGRREACYDPETLATVAHEPSPSAQGPFPSCESCPYPSTGFLCYAEEGKCIRIEMQKIMDRQRRQRR